VCSSDLTGGELPADALEEGELAAQRPIPRIQPVSIAPHYERQGGVQGVIVTYDPDTGEGVVVRDVDRSRYDLAADALVGSLFRMLRQGQRVNFELDGSGRATQIRIGSEADLGLMNVHLE